LEVVKYYDVVTNILATVLSSTGGTGKMAIVAGSLAEQRPNLKPRPTGDGPVRTTQKTAVTGWKPVLRRDAPSSSWLGRSPSNAMI